MGQLKQRAKEHWFFMVVDCAVRRRPLYP
jgi:hypothetical protein